MPVIESKTHWQLGRMILELIFKLHTHLQALTDRLKLTVTVSPSP